MKYEIIGKNIKKHREELGLTQKQLAEQLGISNARLSNWEIGINRPDVEMLANLCRILNVSANTLLALEQPTRELSAEAMDVARAFDNASSEIRAAIRALLSVSSCS